jgi:hypothetical protein
MFERKKLSIFLPTRNRPKYLFYCLKSFLDLKLDKSQIVVIDEESSAVENINNELLSTEQVMSNFPRENFIYEKVKLGTSLQDKLKIYSKNSLNFDYFSLMGDDDLFLKNEGISKCIEVLNLKKDISYAVTSSYMFQDFPNAWTRNFILPDDIFKGEDFLKNFISIENFQHSTVTGIFRLKNIYKTNAFDSLEKILRNNLIEGYGNDTRLYFRNATCGKIASLGKYQTRAIRFHNSSMTFNSPIESSYVYYWNIIENIEYCKNNKINIYEFVNYISYWLKNLLTSHVISTFLYSNENKKKDLILKENNMEFMSYIKEQFSIHKIAMNKEHNFYFKLNYLIKLMPKWLFIKRKNEHYIPKNYYQFIIRILPFYFIIMILPINLIKKIIKKIINKL